MIIQGTVHDTTGIKPLKNAVAMAVRVRDSLLLGFVRTDSEGKFTLRNFDIDTFALTISHPEFDDKTYYIFGHKDNFEINIPSINMPSKAQELEEVIIYANKNPIYYNGDTLVYAADSFHVAENAVVEDLLKKLPGLEIDKDGKIKSQGKAIDQVLVDGDEFFGSDPTIATKNLGASGVETVQVYEKKQENAADGEETIQVLDLRLKDEAKKGYFGRVSAASDFNQFYEGELLMNKFNKTQKISIFLLSANTPKSDFGFGDKDKFGLDNEFSNISFGDDGDVMYYDNGNTAGIPKTLKAGIYYSDKFGKKKQTDFGFNYSYYNSKNNAVSRSRSQYFVQDTSYFSDDSTRVITDNQSHNINLRFKSKLDSLTTLEIRPSLKITDVTQKSLDYSSWRDIDNVFSRSNDVLNNNKSKGITLSNQLKFNRKFMKERREFSANYDISLSDNKINGNLNSTNIFADTSFSTLGYDQNKINNRNSVDNSIRVSYFEPLGKKFKVQTEYSLDLGNSAQIKETKDFNASTGLYDMVNNKFSNSFDNVKTQHRVGAQLWYETKKYTIHGGVRVRNINIDNQNRVTDTLVHQNFTNFLPLFSMRFNPNRSTHIRLNYQTNSRQPAISDLVPVPDNTNPNRVQTGNPNLRPDYSHQVNLNFNTWNALSGRYIYMGVNGNLTQNAFGDSTSFNSIGQQVSRRVNVKNASNGSFWIGAGIPLWGRKIMISPNVSGSVSQYTSYLNSDKNIATNIYFGPSMNVNYRADSLEFEARADFTYNQPRNTLANFSTKAYTSQDYFFGATWRLKHGFKLQANCNYTKNGQRAAGYNNNFFIVNAAVTKSFLKTRNLELSLLANDILNQNISASRNVSQNVVTDNNTKIISRYFLAKLTYRFNNNKTTENDAEDGWH